MYRKNNKQKVYLCGFADLNLGISAYRYYQEALSMEIFEHIFIYNQTNLELDFYRHFQDKFFINGDSTKATRGFGYWCWKPQIILQTLNVIEDNSLLIYAGIGCSFNKEGKECLLEILDSLNENDIIGISTNHKEKCWTKGDVFEYFGVLDNHEIKESHQIAATLIFMRKTSHCVAIIKQWLEIFSAHFELVSDLESKARNDECFIENRHDQSIWSMLNKTNNLKNLSNYFQSPDTYRSNPSLYPIMDLRIKPKIEAIAPIAQHCVTMRNLKINKSTLSLLKLLGKIAFNSNARRQFRFLYDFALQCDKLRDEK